MFILGLFKTVEGKILCLKFNMNAGHYSKERLHPENVSFGHKYLALDNRATENVVWVNVFIGKCPSAGQTSSGKCLSGPKCLSRQMYLILGKCHYGQMSAGQMSLLANIYLGK
jgi:hypothetical protein